MAPLKTDAYKDKANIIKALGHPSRLAMVDYLVAGERCVCELQALVGSDISTVSKHLTILKNAGLVCDRRQGQWIYYRLRTPCLIGFLNCVEAVMKEPCECCDCVMDGQADKPLAGDCG
jgi:DNA-binding transcriptional ArsR family regulator